MCVVYHHMHTLLHVCTQLDLLHKLHSYYTTSTVSTIIVLFSATTVSVSVQRTNIPTKLLDLPSYNGFSLTCTATSRASTQDVALTKVITWMRSVGGGNPRELTESSTSDVIMISNMNLNQATATSELIVNTTSSGSHVYTCAVSVHVSPATDVIQRQNDTTIVVQGW